MKDVFKEFGVIKYLNLFKDKSGKGIVCFKKTPGEKDGETPAEMALKQLKGKPYPNGKKMFIRFNQKKPFGNTPGEEK
jgi:hypothetical protein